MGCILGKEKPQQIPSASAAFAALGNIEKTAPAVLSISSPRSNASAKEVSRANGGLNSESATKVKNEDVYNVKKEGNDDKTQNGDLREQGRNDKEKQANDRLGNLPKHTVGEQVAAGWPSWLSEYAGEAIKGLVPRRADSFKKLEKVWQV